MLTDNTDAAITKYEVGSSVTVLGIFNFLFPNLFLLVREWIQAIVGWAQRQGYLKTRKQRVISEYLDICTKAKQREFIDAYEKFNKINALRWESNFKSECMNYV